MASCIGSEKNTGMAGSSAARRLTLVALLFECGLGGTALVAGWLVGHEPAVGITADRTMVSAQLRAAGIGLAAAAPMFVALLVIERLPIQALRTLRERAEQVVGQMFGGATVLQLAIVSVAAGLGEELLFRGLIQDGLSRLIAAPGGVWMALVLASLVFGVCHWLSATYALLATLAGIYFGLLLLLTGSLWTPITAHAAYDFLALIYILRRTPRPT